MKIMAILIAAVALVSGANALDNASNSTAATMAVADPSHPDERAYTEGPVTEVDYIGVEYGHFEEYIDWLNSTWKPTMEATKKAGLIIDYKVFRLTAKSPDQPNIYLWITYKNAAAALDKGVELEAVAKKVICSTECQNKARVARSEYRLLSWQLLLARRLYLKPQPRFYK